eukprot:symbB.v1.2.013164.t3/scaffold924.1/size151606/11
MDTVRAAHVTVCEMITHVSLSWLVVLGKVASWSARGRNSRQKQWKNDLVLVSMSDSLVALGGILQTATDAYRKAEDSRIEEVKALKMMLEENETKFNKALEDQKAHFEKVLESQKQEMNTLAAEIRGKALLKFTLRDLEGSWFETNSNKRLRLTENGQYISDLGESKKVTLNEGHLQLDGFVLSTQKSSRRFLVWEKQGADPLTWTYEMPGGSRQVILRLSVTELVEGTGQIYNQETGRLELQRYFEYKFSLIGCDLKLMLGRNAKNAEGKYVCGNQDLAVHVGLLKSKTTVGGSPNNVNAINCRVLVEVFDVQADAWVFLLRTERLRLEAGGTAKGSHSSVSLARFKGILGPRDQGNHYHYNFHNHCVGKFRVSITDIGMLELSSANDVIQPS